MLRIGRQTPSQIKGFLGTLVMQEEAVDNLTPHKLCRLTEVLRILSYRSRDGPPLRDAFSSTGRLAARRVNLVHSPALISSIR